MGGMKLTVAAVLAALTLGILATRSYLTTQHRLAITTIQGEYADAVRKASERALAVERKHNNLAQQLEIDNAQQRKKLDAILADNRRLIRELGGLRDPYATFGGSVSTGTTTTGSFAATAGTGYLSDELTELLLSESRRADEVATYADTCYRWVTTLQKGK